MLLKKETTTDLPVALFLFGFANRVFQSPPIKYGIEIAPLFLLRLCRGVEGDKLPPSITPLCRLFSSERIASSPLPHPSTFIQVSKNTETSKHDRLCAEQKGGKKNLMFQPGRQEFIPSILIMCTYRLLLPSLLICLSAFIIVHCFPAEVQSFSRNKSLPGWVSLICFILLFLLLCAELTQSPVWPWEEKKKYSDNTAYVRAHVLLFCLCIHFKSCRLQQPVTDHQWRWDN